MVAEPVKSETHKVKDVPLESIDEWPPELVAKLKELWITSAEQVVAAGATASGISALAEHLNISEDQATRLIAAARSRLSPEVAAEMETPVDTSDYGIGAIKPPKRRRKTDE